MRRTQQIVATDSNGKRRVLNVWVKSIDTSTLQGRSSIDGLPAIRTEDDLAVNRLERGHYQIVATGEILKSNDPNAL
jgi:hypothetical protein